MSSYYFVSNLSMPITRETVFPYRQAVLNAVRFDLDMSGSILIAAINAPKASIEKYWKFGRLGETSGYVQGYSQGLPSRIQLGRYAFNEVRAKNTLIGRYSFLNSPADLAHFQVKVVRGEDVSAYDVAYSHWSHFVDVHNNSIVYNPNNPIGIVTSDAANNPATMHMGSDGIALKRDKVAAGDACGSDRWYLVGLNESPGTPYGYRIFNGTAAIVSDANGNSTLQCVAGSVALTLNAALSFTYPDPDDWVYVYKWSRSSYPEEIITTILNKSAQPWLDLDVPYYPEGDHIYPIIQFRKNLEWYTDYLSSASIKNYERTFRKLNSGRIQNVIDQVSTNAAMSDIDDMFFVLAKDMYSHNTYDMEYVFLHWKSILDTFGNALKQGNDLFDINFIGYIEGDFNAHISFRRLQYTEMHSTSYYPANTRYEYAHTWESDAPPGVDDIHLAPWQYHWVPNEHDPGGHYSIMSIPERLGYEQEYKRMEKISQHVYVVSRHHPNGLLMSQVRIHGLQKHSRLFFDATNQYKWANSILNPDDDDLLQAQYDAQDANPPIEYTGEQASPFMIPLIHEVVKHGGPLSHRGVRRVASTCITLEMYGSKTVYVAWWKEALIFILEALELAAIAVAIATMGTTAAANMAVNTAIEFMYRLGIEVFKQAIVRIILEKGGKELKIVKLVYDLYHGKFGDLTDISNFSIDYLEDLMNFAKAVIEIAIEVKLEKLKEDIANDSMNDYDAEALENIETVDELTDIDVNDLVRLNPKFKNVILFENPKDFLTRTGITAPADVQQNQMKQYGSTPSKSAKYTMNEVR